MTDDDDLYGDDEFGLDEFDDDFDDLDDDFDDLDIGQPHTPQQEAPAYSQFNRVEQTFLQKYFYAVVAFVAISLAGLWFLGQTVTAPRAPQTNEPQQIAQQEDSEDNLITSDNELPMPVPLNSFTEENLPVYKHRERTTPSENEQMYDPGILTPLPEGVSSGYDEIDQIAEIEDPEAQIEIGSLPVDTTDEEVAEESDGGFDDLFSDNPGLTLSVNKSDLEDEKPSVLDTVQNLLDDKPKEKTKKNENSSDMGTIKAELSEINNALSKKIETTDTRIEDLIQAVQALERKVDQLDGRASTASSQKTVSAAPAKETKSTPAPTQTQPTATTTASPKRTVSWQLRSAQTGKAVVAVKGTNDFRTVEVGSTLSGIGKIKSIMIEDGRWVVRGSQGKITQ